MASISSLFFGNTDSAAPKSPAQIRATFDQLAGNLAANNLAGARKAFGTLQQVFGTSGPLAQSLSNLNQALKSGILADARQAFLKFGQDAQSSASGAGSNAGPNATKADQSGTGDTAAPTPPAGPTIPGARTSIDITV